MSRTVKHPEERRKEILSAAGELFQTQGFRETPVDAIVRKAGVAKGTFYYYFQSKEEVLFALVHDLVVQMVEQASQVVSAPQLNALEKIRLLLTRQNQVLQAAAFNVMEELHLPENRELHERVNVETVLLFGPIIAGVVEEGVQEGLFQVDQPLETVQLILAGSQFLMDASMFDWNPDERFARLLALQALIERSLGAATGSFVFIVEDA